MKTGSSEVEVDLALDVDSINYDKGADPRVLIEKQVCFLLHLIWYDIWNYNCCLISRYFVEMIALLITIFFTDRT